MPLGQCQSDASDPANGYLLAAVARPADDSENRRSGKSRVYDPAPAAAQSCRPRRGKRFPHPHRVRPGCPDADLARAIVLALKPASTKPIDPNAVEKTPAILRAHSIPPTSTQALSTPHLGRHE